MEAIPVNFGLKYKPPKLGVQYHIKDQPASFFVHEIPLSFITKGSNVDSVSKEIIEKNKFYLNPKVVSLSQVRRLVERLVKHLILTEDKENSQIHNNKGQQLLAKVGNPVLQKKGLADNSNYNQKQFEMSPTESERSDRCAQQPNQSISRIESIIEGDVGGNNQEVDLLISDIQQNQSLRLEGGEHEDLEQLLKTGAFTKEMMMGQTLRDLGSTIKDVNIGGQQKQSQDEDYNDDFDGSQQQVFEGNSQILNDQFAEGEEFEGEEVSQQQLAGEEEGEAIDIDNPDELAAKGLKRIQIEGEDDEYLMDMGGNIYDLRGNFIGTTDGDQMAAGSSQVIEDGEEQFEQEEEEY